MSMHRCTWATGGADEVTEYAVAQIRRLGDALLEIQRLHKPVRINGGVYCDQCLVLIEDEPCETVRVINDVLGGA